MKGGAVLSFKSKKEKKKDVKEKRKNTEENLSELNSEQHEMKKSDILSKLDRLDDISKAETRLTEDRLRKGLLKIEKVDKDKPLEKQKISISEIRNKVEELKILKRRYYEEGDYAETIRIAKEIIDIAAKNEMDSTVIEEKEFIKQIQNIISTTPAKPIEEQIEEIKILKQNHYAQEEYEEAIQKARIIIDLAYQANLTSVVQAEENFITLMKEKLNQNKISKLESIEQLRDIRMRDWADEIKVDLGNIKVYDIDKYKKDKLKFEKEKEKFEKEKREFEEKKEEFKFEKQMFEELKKHEADKLKDSTVEEATIIELERKHSEEKNEFKELILKFNIEKEKFELEKSMFQKDKDNFQKEKAKFEEEKEKLREEKLMLEEEKERIKFEKQMLEEVKKFEKDEEKP